MSSLQRNQEGKQTDRKEKKKRQIMDKRMLSSGCQVFLFSVLFVFWATKIDENGVPGLIRDQGGIQTPKKREKIMKKGLDFDQGTSVLGCMFVIFRIFL